MQAQKYKFLSNIKPLRLPESDSHNFLGNVIGIEQGAYYLGS